MDQELLERLVKLETLLGSLKEDNQEDHALIRKDIEKIHRECQRNSEENRERINALERRTDSLEKREAIVVVKWKTLGFLAAGITSALLAYLVRYLLSMFL